MSIDKGYMGNSLSFTQYVNLKKTALYNHESINEALIDE